MNKKRKIVATILILIAIAVAFYFITQAITKMTGYSIWPR